MSIGVGGALFACGSPAPEALCFEDAECGVETPVCANAGGLCSRACTTSAQCGDLELQTSCDSMTGLCARPCAADAVGQFACMDGDRVYCADDPALSCAICGCDIDSFCDGTACQPRRAAGEACGADAECTSAACTDAGQCSVAQGESCTLETCDGVCAERPSGETLCIRSRCSADCEESTAGGLEWTCVRYDTYEACVPVESCIWQDGCSTFVDSTCGQSCYPSGGCWTYCVPNVISTDDD